MKKVTAALVALAIWNGVLTWQLAKHRACLERMINVIVYLINKTIILPEPHDVPDTQANGQ